MSSNHIFKGRDKEIEAQIELGDPARLSSIKAWVGQAHLAHFGPFYF